MWWLCYALPQNPTSGNNIGLVITTFDIYRETLRSSVALLRRRSMCESVHKEVIVKKTVTHQSIK